MSSQDTSHNVQPNVATQEHRDHITVAIARTRNRIQELEQVLQAADANTQSGGPGIAPHSRRRAEMDLASRRQVLEQLEAEQASFESSPAASSNTAASVEPSASDALLERPSGIRTRIARVQNQLTGYIGNNAPDTQHSGRERRARPLGFGFAALNRLNELQARLRAFSNETAGASDANPRELRDRPAISRPATPENPPGSNGGSPLHEPDRSNIRVTVGGAPLVPDRLPASTSVSTTDSGDEAQEVEAALARLNAIEESRPVPAPRRPRLGALPSPSHNDVRSSPLYGRTVQRVRALQAQLLELRLSEENPAERARIREDLEYHLQVRTHLRQLERTPPPRPREARSRPLSRAHNAAPTQPARASNDAPPQPVPINFTLNLNLNSLPQNGQNLVRLEHPSGRMTVNLDGARAASAAGAEAGGPAVPASSELGEIINELGAILNTYFEQDNASGE
ncbi:hypothetical protein BU26DRAFT_602392 [Trematosphaeria pertusa]|uniref:Uncharacterized protein n=1 Tax=Trematosphaeria pertusa TaxID=390896 RepID=A0A6A6IN67_9PLEO|nr:uncharacterized protein BU26DRAFT_602392 [Trematosphaeria pertusa]KAF2251901.1 hypothetical protein BU26DRAFT_602392 [Trematosphaeria pertusa]